MNDYDLHILTPENKNKLVDFKDNNSIRQCFVNIHAICRASVPFVSAILEPNQMFFCEQYYDGGLQY